MTSPDAPPRPRIVGSPATSIFAGIVDDWMDDNADTRGDLWYGRFGVPGVGHKMMRDPHVLRMRDAVVDPIVGATWDFQPASDAPIDKEIASFARHAIIEATTWHEFIGRASKGYIRDGFALFEQTDELKPVSQDRFPNHPGMGFGVMVTGYHYRPAFSIEKWEPSRKDPSKLWAVEQYIPGSDAEPHGYQRVRSDRLIRFTWDQEAGDFAGNSPLRAVYAAWKYKVGLELIEAQSHERNHMAQPFVMLDKDIASLSSDELDKLFTAMQEFRGSAKGANVVPPGASVDFKSGQANTPIQITIERKNLDIAMAVAAQFQLLGSKGTSASYALAQTQEGQFRITLDKHSRFICDVINVGADGWSLVERIVRLNYGERVALPKLITRNMPTVDFREVIPLIIKSKQAGLLHGDEELEKWVRKVSYAPDMDEATRDKYRQQEAPQLNLFEENEKNEN